MRNAKYRIIPIWTVLCLLAAGCLLPFCSAGAASAEKNLTLMVYMAGSDLETQNGAATADIQEMLASGCDFSRVNLVILAGGAEQWHMGLSSDELSVIELGARGMRIRERFPKASMGAPETLSTFLSYAKEHFPARNYALVFWNHGGGPLEGVCYDELYGRDRLSMEELAEALEASPFSGEERLNWIGFDACLMAALETASVCADYARYMIASQETEPAAGWNYSFLASAADHPDGAEIGGIIVDAYMQANPDSPALTLSCTDLNRLGLLRIAVSDLFQRLRDGMNSQTFSTLSNMRRDTRGFGRVTTLSDYDLVDLYHLSEQYAPQAPEEARKLQEALEYAVIYSSSHEADAHGLSVYSPYYNKSSYQDTWLQTYEKMGITPNYLSYIRRYSSFWLGDQLADWSGLAGRALPAAEDGSQTVEMPLTEEQLSHFASARMVILRDQGYDNSYFQVYEIANLQPENGMLRAAYDFSGLYVIDEHGNPISDIYPFFTLTDGQYALVAELEKESMYRTMVRGARGEETGTQRRFVNLVCTRDDGTDTLEVRNVISPPEDASELTTGRQYVTLSASDWPNIYFSANRYAYILTRDADSGRLLPYSQWPSSSIPIQDRTMIDSDGSVLSVTEWTRRYHEQTADEQNWLFFSEVDNRRPWSLQFRKGLDSSQQFYAQFIVTDTQGVESATELIPLRYSALKDSESFDRELYRDEDASITLQRVDVIRANGGSGLYFRFRIENRTNRILNFVPADLWLNQTSVDNTALILPSAIEPRSVMQETVCLPVEDIPYLENRLTRIGFTAALWEPGHAKDYTLAAEPLELETDLDLSSLEIAQPGTGNVCAESGWDGTDVQLMDLKEGKDGALEGILHFTQRGNETEDISFFLSGEDELGDVIINGCYFRDSLHASHASVLMPSGYDLYIPFTLDRRVQLDPVGEAPEASRILFPVVDGMDYWGITEIRSLSVPLNVNGELRMIDFSLADPLKLTETKGMNVPDNSSDKTNEDYTEAEPLLREAPVSLALRGIELTRDGQLRLMTDVRNLSIRDLCFRLMDCMVDDRPAEPGYASETWLRDDVFSGGWITLTATEGMHRMVIELNPADGDIPFMVPSAITLSVQTAETEGYARYSGELDWHSSEETVLLRRTDSDPASAERTSFPEQWDIRMGSMKPELNLSEMLGGHPEAPENWRQYARTLRLPLTAGQAQRIDSAVVSLAVPVSFPDVPPDACLLLANLTQLRLDGNDLTADFAGLLSCIRDNEYPLFQYVFREEEGWLFLAQEMVAEMHEATLYAPHARLTLSDGENTATTGEYYLWEENPEGDEQAYLSDGLEVYRIPGLTEGKPPHWEDWEYVSMVTDGVPLRENLPEILFRLASDWKNLWVIFSITDTDGSRWAVSLPYTE
ncbi:MAG: hypothetical protein K5922_02365 [Clostridiales bacterium]|nr:hypothetical protein [Clostridiales bacterium]